jgi:methylmalonyl-CoA/ethylmalonyl-CoA epimerase
VHHICFTVDDPEDALRRLSEAGLSTTGDVNTDPTMPWQRWTWVLADSGHGTLVEVARPYKAVDGTWESASPDA